VLIQQIKTLQGVMHRGNSAGTSTGIVKLRFQDAVKNPTVIQHDATLLLIIRKSNKMLTIVVNMVAYAISSEFDFGDS
jgi:hypothetical protein